MPLHHFLINLQLRGKKKTKKKTSAFFAKQLTVVGTDLKEGDINIPSAVGVV